MNNEEIRDEYDGNNLEVDVNRKNSEHFESVMKDASVDLDKFYWDKDNIIIKLILIGLAIFIIVGVVMVFVFS